MNSVRLGLLFCGALSACPLGCGSRTALDLPGMTVRGGGSSRGAGSMHADGGVDAHLSDAHGSDATADATTDATIGRPESGIADVGSDHAVLRDAGDDQFATLDAGLAPPRLLAPLSTSRVTSRRPTLRWALPPGIPDVTVDLCLDRACNHPIGTSMLVTGTSYSPPTDLPTGVVFWRLHPSIETSVTSATWEFTVGAHSATVDTSWGTAFDVNGDGYADLVVTLRAGPTLVPGERTAYIYLGGPAGPATSPSTTLPLAGSGDFEPIGDVNGDGYADIAFATVAGSSADVYLGSAAGLATTPASTLTLANDVNDAGSIYYVAYFASAGDVNGDGYGDVVAGTDEVGVGDASAFVQLFLGGPGGLTAAPVTTTTFKGGLWGVAAIAGDFNGDGYDDAVVPLEDPRFDGGVYEFVVDDMYLGGPSGWGAMPSAFATQGFSDPEPEYPLGGADINGDGYADVVVLSDFSASAGGAGTLCAYLGGASGIASTPPPACDGIPSGSDGFATGGIATVGDVNGDGYSDVISAGLVFFGSPTGLPETPSGAAPWGSAFVSATGAGDVNGDGYSDVAMVEADGPVTVYFGGPGGLPATPSITLSRPGADAGLAASYVRGATN